MAMPGEYFRDAPARRKVIGIMDAVPNPTRQNPIIDGQKYGKATAKAIPIKTSEALPMYVFGIPNSSINRSDAKRDNAIKIIKMR